MPTMDPRMHVASTMQWIKSQTTAVGKMKARSLNSKLSACVGSFNITEVKTLVQNEGAGKISIADYKKRVEEIIEEAEDWRKELSEVVEKTMAKDEMWAGILVKVRKAVADCKVSIAKEAKTLLQ